MKGKTGEKEWRFGAVYQTNLKERKERKENRAEDAEKKAVRKQRVRFGEKSETGGRGDKSTFLVNIGQIVKEGLFVR